MDDRRKVSPLFVVLGILVPILFIALVGLIILCVKLSNEKKQAEKLAAEFSVAIEEQNAVKKAAARYQENYNRMVLAMLDDAALAETNGNLIVKVWHNAIWSEQDPATDKYTMVNGKYVEDFNDALAKLFADESFGTDMEALKSNLQGIKADMKEMVNPPDKCEEEYKALKDLYDSYLAFVNFVVFCKGSYDSFSAGLKEVDDAFMKQYYTAELYMK